MIKKIFLFILINILFIGYTYGNVNYKIIKELNKIDKYSITSFVNGFYGYKFNNKNIITNGVKIIEYDSLGFFDISSNGENSLFQIINNGKIEVIHNFEKVKFDFDINKNYKFDHFNVSEEGNHYSFYIYKNDNGKLESYLYKDGKKYNMNGVGILDIIGTTNYDNFVYTLIKGFNFNGNNNKSICEIIINKNGKIIYSNKIKCNDLNLNNSNIGFHNKYLYFSYFVKNSNGNENEFIIKNGVDVSYDENEINKYKSYILGKRGVYVENYNKYKILIKNGKIVSKKHHDKFNTSNGFFIDDKKFIYVIGSLYEGCHQLNKISYNGIIINEYINIMRFKSYLDIGHYSFIANKKEGAKIQYLNNKDKCYEIFADKNYVIIDGHESEGYDEIINDVKFYDNGNHYYYTVKNNGLYYFILDGKKSEGFDEINNILDNGKNVYFIGIKGNKYFLLKNGIIVFETNNRISYLNISNKLKFIMFIDNKVYIYQEVNKLSNKSYMNIMIGKKGLFIKNIILLTDKIKNINNGEKYIYLLDKIVEKNKFNYDKMLSLYIKIDNLMLSGKIKQNSLGILLEYLQSKIGLFLLENH